MKLDRTSKSNDGQAINKLLKELDKNTFKCKRPYK